MGLFSFTKKEEEKPEWIAQAQENKERIFIFFDKLEAKMKELCEAAIPELTETLNTDDDIYKRTYGRLAAGIKGQLENIRKKAYDIYEEKINDFYSDVKSDVSVMSPYYDVLSDFRTACSDRYHKQFEEQYQYWREKIDETSYEDMEVQYKKILDEFEAIKNKFNCKQCGGNIAIEKIFFITTFITCPHCQTQNTFEPSTQAGGLESLGRELAEQRTAHLLKAYNDENKKERDLYHERHTLSLSRIHEKDKKELARVNQLMDELELQRQNAIKDAPPLYEKYLRAMFDEWNKIVPDLAIHNEKFYERMLNDFRNRN
jgi:RNA polymerase-binding transcription factor DksA